MIHRLVFLARGLRQAGLPISTAEVMDCAQGASVIDLADREQVAALLASTLLKNQMNSAILEAAVVGLIEELAETVPLGDAAVAASQVVDAHAGMDEGRRFDSSYHVRRAIRRSGDALPIAAEQESEPMASESQIASEVLRRLAEDGRWEAEVRRATEKMPDNIDFLRAQPDEQKRMSRAADALGRQLAHRLRGARRGRPTSLDMRATLRRAQSSGGTPVVLVTRRRLRSRPNLIVLADVSGSVATFARFNLRLLHSLSSQYRSVRTYAFVDDVSDVTRFFRLRRFDQAMAAVNGKASPHGGAGHSDYGYALQRFVKLHLAKVSSTTTVLVMGDARNNYHPSNEQALLAIANKAARVIWLNPEPRAYWDTADSLASRYAAHCDEMFECRNLAQLGNVIAKL